MATQRTGGISPWFWIVLAALFALFVALVLVPVVTQERAPVQEVSLGETGVTVNDILQNPDAFTGQVVTINGKVGAVIDRQTFILVEQGPPFVVEQQGPGVGQGLVVFEPDDSSTQPALSVGSFVRITGTVRPLNVEAFEQDLGRQLDEVELRPFNGKPALIATEIFVPPAGEQP